MLCVKSLKFLRNLRDLEVRKKLRNNSIIIIIKKITKKILLQVWSILRNMKIIKWIKLIIRVFNKKIIKTYSNNNNSKIYNKIKVYNKKKKNRILKKKKRKL